MKQGKIVNAYKALRELEQEKMPMKTAYKLYKLRKQLEKGFDFQREQEEKLLEDFGAKVLDGGLVQFQTVDDRKAYEAQIAELNDMESDVEVNPVDMGLTDEVSITPDAIEALEGIVNFLE